MSTPNTELSEAIPPVNEHALSKIASGMDLAAKIKAAKQKADAAREAAKKAAEDLLAASKPRRDQSRDDDRRAMLVGRLVLAQMVVDRSGWNAMWPDLVASLGAASTKDRALFGLPPMPVVKDETPKKAVKNKLGAEAENSTAADRRDVQQPVEESALVG